MTLAELQARFQAGILTGEGADMLGLVEPSPHGAGKNELFGVYQNAYRLRLAEFVAEDHPGLAGYLGEDEFAALIEDFIASDPPRHRNARYYTTRLPQFMQESEAWREEGRALSLAQFERALVDAFDAADAPALEIGALAAFAPERWASLTFAFHASAQLLELAAGTLDTYVAATDDDCDELPEASEGVEHAAIWRTGDEPAWRELDADEWVALNEAMAGQAFGDICQLAAFQQGDNASAERLAQFLANWFSEGLVVGVAEKDAG